MEEEEILHSKYWEEKEDRMLKISSEYKEKYKKSSWLQPIRKYNYYKLWQSAKGLILKSWIKEIKQ